MGRAFEAVDPNVPCSRVRFFSCAMVTRGYVNLTPIALKELSVSHVLESGLKSTFVFQVASKASLLSGVRISHEEGRSTICVSWKGFGRIITNSSHMITQTMPDLKLKPQVSRRKLKGLLKLKVSKMFSPWTGRVSQVHYPWDDNWHTFKRMFSCWLKDRAAIICRFRNEENWSS